MTGTTSPEGASNSETAAGRADSDPAASEPATSGSAKSEPDASLRGAPAQNSRIDWGALRARLEDGLAEARVAGAKMGAASLKAGGAALEAGRGGLAVAERRLARAAREARLMLGGAEGRLPAWMRFEQPGKRRRNALLAIGLAVAGPLLAILTYTILSSNNQSAIDSAWFQALLVADILYLVTLIAMIGVKIARLVAARRARSAGARLHGRMVAVFAGVAAAPTILVAVFFLLVIQLGFQSWFSEQVGSVVRNSREVARAYLHEHRQAIASQTLALAREISAGASELIDGARDPRFPALVTRATENAPFVDAYVIDGEGVVIARSDYSFLFSYTAPDPEDIDRAQSGVIVVRQGEDRDQLNAIVRLESDAYLYVTRPVSPEVLRSLSRTDEGVRLYNRLEENRDAWMAQFAVLYLGFAALVLAAAIYLGLWFAERLARPIARLSEAARRVGEGDLTTRVKEERGEDDLALLSRAFNQMTEEVRRKQEALHAANQQSEERRQFSEAVVLGVPAGVIGLDAAGGVRVINHAAAELLDIVHSDALGRRLAEITPEFAALLADAALEPAETAERQIRLVRRDVEHELLVRVTTQRASDEPSAPSGFVVTIDDLTDLNSAQRLAAWGDVARRVAHEIKNPLTPIQLAAERLRRKYAERLGEDAEGFERYIETIVRQTADIGRMVDAFVRFAKMPTPKMALEPLDAVVREAVLLQQEGRTGIAYDLEIGDPPPAGPGAPAWAARCDRGQINQALTNLLTNAADAIHARRQQEAAEGREPGPAEIRVRLSAERGRAVIAISDNGIGLPAKERRRLLEPYVTTREKGTGLGLAIVSKILEEHKGALELLDAEPFKDGARRGACARLSLPLTGSRQGGAVGGDQEQAGPPAGADAA